MSVAVLDELRQVLGRKRLRRYIPLGATQGLLSALARDGHWVDVNIEIRACRDPKDDKFLSLAVSGNATHIVTGDQDLLALDPFRGIRILAPQDFLALP